MRDQRHRLLRINAEARRKHWHRDPHNLLVLLLHMIDECGDRDEIKRVVGEIMSKPYNWRTEFVIAKCRQLDSTEAA